MRCLPALLERSLAERWRASLAALQGASQPLPELPAWPALQPAWQQLHGLLQSRLGAAPQRVASQSWVRRGTAPHGWHQDGALHHDFIAQPTGQPLAMWTCWIALSDCGDDAPGLEAITPSLDALLAPAELVDAALRRRFSADAFHRPVLRAGDALLFDGGQLHRTHWRASMRAARTSVELRFIAAGPAPARLARETLQPFPPAGYLSPMPSSSTSNSSTAPGGISPLPAPLSP